jgi:hypothetical protein
MNQNKFTFQSENLVVDYISFKFQYLDNSTQTEIANYLLKLGFNSYHESGKLAKPRKESILVSSQNKCEVLFVADNPYWDGTILHFSGLNAKTFYSCAQKGFIDWTVFSSATLGRFDLYYLRNNKKEDKLSASEFFENCKRQLEETNKNVSSEKNQKGLILKIGSRRSNNYSRIYETKNSLKFEHEMKGNFIEKYHFLLVLNNLEEFEQKLSSHFLVYFGKLLPLNFSYLDWLVLKLRPIRKQQISPSGLKLDYLDTKNLESLDDRKKFYSLLQFLVYADTLDYTVDCLEPTFYRKVVFRVKDFLKYKNPTCRSTNYYQLEKLLVFFDELQENSLIKSFSDTEYRSLVTIPEVSLKKSKQNVWTATVWIAEKLFSYAHPFLLSNFVKSKMTKDEFEVQFKVIQIISSINIEKIFLIEDFFQNYTSTISNQNEKIFY